MIRMFKEYYLQERYRLVAYYGQEIVIRDGTYRASILVASWRTMIHVVRRMFFNIFLRRRAMRKFESDLDRSLEEFEAHRPKKYTMRVECKELYTEDEVEQVWKDAKQSFLRGFRKKHGN
jgi:hypothetical protein